MARQTSSAVVAPRRPDIEQDDESLRLLVETVPDYAIILLDPHGNVRSWNGGAERIKGYRADEILGQNFAVFCTPEDRQRGKPEQELATAAEKGRFSEENWRVRKDGSRFWASVTLATLRDPSGQLRGFGKITRDLTERRRMEEDLRRAKEDLEQKVQALNAELSARRRAEEAVRALSTPVLPLRDRLLILPIIGVIDSDRAMQLTEELLASIRAHRARAVVMDITGVPVVDSRVANHLLQTVEAARLMGAAVIVTGLSPEIAQTLVRIGVDLSRLQTTGDLRGGLEEAEGLLGYRVVLTDGASGATLPATGF